MSRVRPLPAWLGLAWLGLALWLPGCSEGPRRPLVLITVDTLRADHLGAYGSTLGASPQLDALAARSTRFTRTYAPAPFTLASVGSLLTGRYPLELGLESNQTSLPADVPTLASALREQGWTTAAVVSNFVLRRASGLDRGFDAFDDETPQVERNRRLPERIAASTTDAALRQLDRLGEGPFFLWVHYQDPHGPYTPPEALRELFLPEARRAPDGLRELPVSRNLRGLSALPRYQLLDDHREVAWYRAGYAGEVRYMDAEVGRLLAGLAERGLAERSVIALSADHGEALGERDHWFAHGEYLSDAELRVPLLLSVPQREPGVRDDVASLLDLTPTLLAAVGARPLEGVHGRNLLAPGAEAEQSGIFLSTYAHSSVPRRGVAADGAVLELTFRRPGAVEERVTRIDLRGETEDTSAERRDALQEQLRSIRLGLEEREASPQTLSPAERERLRALGYAH